MNSKHNIGREAQLDKEIIDIPDGYGAYVDLLRPMNEGHPQYQGLQPEEFASAIEDERTLFSEVDNYGETVRIPQLVSIDHFEWLNNPRYEREFPEAVGTGIYHFTHIPGLEPSQQVLDGIKDITDRGGKIVFDYPSQREEYKDGILDTFANAGVEVESIDDIARQTYYSGGVRLIRTEEREDYPPVGMADAFKLLEENNTYDPSRYENGASLATIISKTDATNMYSFYETAYTGLNTEEFCSQGIPKEEFLEMCEDETVAKIINTDDGEIVSLMFLDNDLEKLTWVNDDFYRDLFREKYDNGQVMWFPGLAANPNKKSGFNTQVMVDLGTELIEAGRNEIVVVFDTGILNTGFLDKFLSDMINATQQVRIDMKTIATQSYCAVRTKPN